MTPCPECERNKFRAAMWRAEAYKQAGNDVIERPWVGLTAKDLAEIPPSAYEGAIWADAKLKEKNT